MQEINYLIGGIALAALITISFLHHRWKVQRTVKTFGFRKRFFNLLCLVSIVLAVAVMINTIVMMFKGTLSDGIYALFVLALAVISGLRCRFTLQKNFYKEVTVGRSYPFFIGAVGADRIEGYLVVDGCWLEAIVRNPSFDQCLLDEGTQVDGIIDYADPDEKGIVVII